MMIAVWPVTPTVMPVCGLDPGRRGPDGADELNRLGAAGRALRDDVQDGRVAGRIEDCGRDQQHVVELGDVGRDRFAAVFASAVPDASSTTSTGH